MVCKYVLTFYFRNEYFVTSFIIMCCFNGLYKVLHSVTFGTGRLRWTGITWALVTSVAISYIYRR